MDIRDAIQKVTQIPKTNENASFVRLTKPDQATLDRNMNKRRIRPPRNAKLLDDDSSPVDSYNWKQKYSLKLPVFNEYEIITDVNSVNGGVSYSNKFVENHWRSIQWDYNSNVKHSNTSTSNSKSSHSCNKVVETSNIQNVKSNDSKENAQCDKQLDSVEEVLKLCKLSKNAVILGLLNNNKITVKDLQIPGTQNLKNEKSQNLSATQAHDTAVRQCLIQHPEETDIYLHSLQMMDKFGKSRGNVPDFVVDHIGVKKTVTARQYYIQETNDMSFEFVKKKKNET